MPTFIETVVSGSSPEDAYQNAVNEAVEDNDEEFGGLDQTNSFIIINTDPDPYHPLIQQRGLCACTPIGDNLWTVWGWIPH